MTTIYNWDTKKVTEVSLPPEIINKYISKPNFSILDIEDIFKTSYIDFKKEDLRIDYFSEVANKLWGILVRQNAEKSKISDIVLMATKINFYLQSNNFDMIDEILDEIEKYLENKSK